MKIDFIKKCVPYADGFVILTWDSVEVIKYSSSVYRLSNITNWDLWPHLLTRTIEGINRYFYTSDGKYLILPCGAFQYEVFFDETLSKSRAILLDGWTFKDIDEAKTAALKYVFEMERKTL